MSSGVAEWTLSALAKEFAPQMARDLRAALGIDALDPTKEKPDAQ